jgi:hypothetical protein
MKNTSGEKVGMKNAGTNRNSSVTVTNPGIEIRNCVYFWDGKEIPLFSGEFSYWAVMRDNWRAVAKSVKAMGIDIVGSYIPWSHHEISPGEYDWTGKTSPQRDVIGFIDTMKEEGLYVILRPGPYIYAGWPHGGPPERIGGMKLDRLSPEFMREGRIYIETICRDVLASRQITRGGNILMLQADNEPYPFIEQLGEELGCYEKTGMFKDWLQKKYRGDLDALNLRWKTSYKSFNEPSFYFHEICVNTELAMADRLLQSPDYRIRYADSFEFIGWYAAEVVRSVSGWMRESGIDIPISANSWSPLFADFGKFCEVADISGMDLYPAPNFTDPLTSKGKRSYSVKDSWFSNVDIVKMTEADVTRGNVWSAEFQAGIFPINKSGYIPPSHFRFITLALMAHGLKAWNWYLLVTQYSWPNSPINEWGWPNEYYPVHKDVLALTRRIEPWNLTALNDVGLVVYKPHRVIDPGNFETMFYALESENIRFAYSDLQCSGSDLPPFLVYSGSEWLAAPDLRRIETYVENGGTLITFNKAPLMDEFGNPTRLPFTAPEGARPVLLPIFVNYKNGSASVSNAGHLGCKVNMCYFRNVEGEPLRACVSEQSKQAMSLSLLGLTGNTAGSRDFTMGYARSFGKGKIIFIGSNPSARILRMILEQEGYPPCASVGTPLITTSCFRHSDGSLILFAINRNDYPCKVPINLNLKRLGLDGNTIVTDLSMETAATARILGNDGELEVSIDAYDVAVMRLKKI